MVRFFTFAILIITVASCGFIWTSGSINNDLVNYKYFVYISNYATGTLSAYELNYSTGSLTQIAGSPYAVSTEAWEITVTPNNRFLYLSTVTPGNVYGFSINQTTGALTAITGSPWAVGGSPQGLDATPDSRFLYIARAAAVNIGGYSIAADGSLSAVAGSPFAAASLYTVRVTPNGSYLYSNNGGGSQVQGYSINSGTGALAALGGSPFAIFQGVNYIDIHPNGNFMAVMKGNFADFDSYSIDGSGNLSLVNTVASALNDSVATISPAGNCAFITNNGAGTVRAFTMSASTGTIAAAPGSPFTVGTAPEAVAIDPSGRYLIVTHTGSNDIYIFTINSNCSITQVGTPLAGADPAGIYAIRIVQ